MGASAGIRVANVFHAGDGNLHPLILFDGREPGALERAEALAGEILRLCVGLGGSITGEHGVGVEKRDYLPLMFSEDDLALMRRLRGAVDPAELANRGKMLRPGRGGRSVVITAGAEALRDAVRDTEPGRRLLPVARRDEARRCRAAGRDDVMAARRLGPARHRRVRPGRADVHRAGRARRSPSVEAALAEHGQYLPFDPPLAAAGATLGGAVAAGRRGPGRLPLRRRARLRDRRALRRRRRPAGRRAAARWSRTPPASTCPS